MIAKLVFSIFKNQFKIILQIIHNENKKQEKAPIKSLSLLKNNSKTLFNHRVLMVNNFN